MKGLRGGLNRRDKYLRRLKWEMRNIESCGKDYKNKDVAKTLFLDFLDEPINSARRITHDGTYQDYYVINQNIKVHIILLDVRYNMIPDVDVLGDK